MQPSAWHLPLAKRRGRGPRLPRPARGRVEASLEKPLELEGCGWEGATRARQRPRPTPRRVQRAYQPGA